MLDRLQARSKQIHGLIRIECGRILITRFSCVRQKISQDFGLLSFRDVPSERVRSPLTGEFSPSSTARRGRVQTGGRPLGRRPQHPSVRTEPARGNAQVPGAAAREGVAEPQAAAPAPTTARRLSGASPKTGQPEKAASGGTPENRCRRANHGPWSLTGPVPRRNTLRKTPGKPGIRRNQHPFC